MSDDAVAGEPRRRDRRAADDRARACGARRTAATCWARATSPMTAARAHGLRPLRALALRARADRLDRHAPRRVAGRRLRDADRRRGRRASPSRSSRSPPPGGRIAEYCLAVGKVRYQGEPSRSCWPSRASSPATRPSSSRSSTSRCRRSSTASARPRPDAPLLHEEVGTNVVWHGVYDYGDVDWALAGGRPRREDRPPALPPLQLDAARVQRGGRQLGRRHRRDRDPLEQPDARVAVIGMAPGAPRRRQPDPLPLAGHRRRVRDQDRQLPADHGACACSRRKAGRPAKWTEYRTDHMHSAEPRQRAHLPRRCIPFARRSPRGKRPEALDVPGSPE